MNYNLKNIKDAHLFFWHSFVEFKIFTLRDGKHYPLRTGPDDGGASSKGKKKWIVVTSSVSESYGGLL